MSKKKKTQKDPWEFTSKFINLNKQLAFLRENKRRINEDQEIYFSEKQDRMDVKRYYYSLADRDTHGLDLYSKLNGLLEKTHKNRIPYFISKDLYLYTWVDLYPDGTVKSIYTGEKKNPESLILYDHDIVTKKYDEFEQFLEKAQRREFELFKQLKAIERKLKLNTEHIVPQSWFSGLEPMKGDLHHLFVCEPDCNIARSNFPYHDFSKHPNEEFVHNSCGAAANDLFEPEYGKGLAARAMLYFLIRYPYVIKKAFRSQINLPLLVQWHQNFPVSLYEKHRNQSIFRIQGNRNPFIDYPELVNTIIFPAI